MSERHTDYTMGTVSVQALASPFYHADMGTVTNRFASAINQGMLQLWAEGTAAASGTVQVVGWSRHGGGYVGDVLLKLNAYASESAAQDADDFYGVDNISVLSGESNSYRLFEPGSGAPARILFDHLQSEYLTVECAGTANLGDTVRVALKYMST